MEIYLGTVYFTLVKKENKSQTKVKRGDGLGYMFTWSLQNLESPLSSQTPCLLSRNPRWYSYLHYIVLPKKFKIIRV